MSNINAILAEIAKRHFGIPTLETRRSDSLDFHDVAVWSLAAALKAAFDAGAASVDAPAQALLVELAGISDAWSNAEAGSEVMDYLESRLYAIREAIAKATNARRQP